MFIDVDQVCKELPKELNEAEEQESKKSKFAGHTYGKLDPNKKIPRVIHQIWINKDNEIPDSYKKSWRESWKKKMPSWKVKVWYKEDVEELLRKKYPEVLKKYESFGIPVCKADIARLAILHSEGGVYVDLDFACLIPINNWIKNKNALFIAYEPENIKTTFIKNSIIGSCAGHPYFLKTLESLKASPIPKDYEWGKTPKTRHQLVESATRRAEFISKTAHNPKRIEKWRKKAFWLRKHLERMRPLAPKEAQFHNAVRKGKSRYVFEATGPRFVGNNLKGVGDKDLSISLIPLKHFFPYEGKDRIKFKDKETFRRTVYGVHKYTALWMKK
ncbi:MAG: hypothetical protein L7U87_04940 [Chlamydiales bacterium]|nr:hypothetical protein [Chlamydiales bacterium]